MEVSASHFTFVSLLLIISLVAMLARRTRVPYTVAVALSIPTAIQGRDQILVMTFGVVLFSLLVQGLTMRPLLRLLRLVQPVPEQLEYEYTRGKLVATRAATDTLQRMQQEGLVSASTYGALSERYDSLGQKLSEDLASIQITSGSLAKEELAATHRECLLVAKGALQDLLRQGMISDDVFRRLVSDIDTELQEVG